MSTGTNQMSIHDGGAHMLAPTAQGGNDGLPTHSMPILQPVFIPRQPGEMFQQTNAPTSPGSLAATASADWAFLLRNAAAMTSGGNGTPTLDMGQLAGSSPNNIQELVAGRRSSPQIHSSPNVLYSPMTSTAPNNMFNSSSMMDFATGGVSTDPLGSADPNMLAAMHLSNNSNLSSSLSAAAAAMYGGDGGVQTLYGSTSQLALAAAGAAAARQTQTLLQQQQAAVNSLSNGMGNMALSGGMGNGLGKIEESLSGSLFSAAAAAAAAAAAGQSTQKPVSSSLYIKNLPPDADKLFLYEKFSPYGAILSVKVLNDPQSGQCRGVGFVNFAEHQSALRSIQALHGSKVGDKLMHVSLQTPRIRASAVQMP